MVRRFVAHAGVTLIAKSAAVGWKNRRRTHAGRTGFTRRAEFAVIALSVPSLEPAWAFAKHRYPIRCTRRSCTDRRMPSSLSVDAAAEPGAAGVLLSKCRGHSSSQETVLFVYSHMPETHASSVQSLAGDRNRRRSGNSLQTPSLHGSHCSPLRAIGTPCRRRTRLLYIRRSPTVQRLAVVCKINAVIVPAGPRTHRSIRCKRRVLH